MRLVVLNNYRLGVFKDGALVDVSDTLPFWSNEWPQMFMVKLCKGGSYGYLYRLG